MSKKRKHSYKLTYTAKCNDPQVEQGIRGYLDWVDKELRECRDELADHTGRWQDLVLPQKVKRNIKSIGYESGPYRLTLDQGKVLDLLVGNDLYADQSVFVRELIQNAIDAVRTRQELDNTHHSWKPRIDIHTWTDSEGYQWFRIEDNGVGMTKETILNHLLKVGSSYYASDDFKHEKHRQHASPDYTPISRFGIGILSCFMANDGTAQVEINTRHYETGTPLRLHLDGTGGFYRLSNGDKKHLHHPGPMKGRTNDERREYLMHPGTVVAVRTNLFASGIYGGFKEIVDKYVAFPPVPIHYVGDEGTFPYPTEQDLVSGARGADPDAAERGSDPAKDVIDLPIPVDAVERIQRVWPEFRWPQDCKVQLGYLRLGAYTKSLHVAGAAVVARIVGDFPTFTHRFGTQGVELRVRVNLDPVAPYAEGSPTIRIGIKIRPTGAGTNAIDDMISRYRKHVYADDIISRQTQIEDPCLADIFDALRNPGVLDRSWRDSMMRRFTLTKSAFDQEVERARNIICQRTGLTSAQVDLAMRLSQVHEWHVEVCDLSTLGWYTSLFGGSRKRTGHGMIVAHNGIFCDSAKSLFGDEDSQCVAAVLLLKDKLRPNLGLARDGIRSYTLETQLVLEAMRRRMQADGFHLGEDHLTHSLGRHLLDANAYEEVLTGNEAHARDLTLTLANDEQVRIDELAHARQRHELAPSSLPILMRNDHDDCSGSLERRYQRFCLARAQQLFTIRASFDNEFPFPIDTGEVWLFPKEEGGLPQGYRWFPPAFFALPLSTEEKRLAISNPGRRHWINAAHPLAQFLLQNADVLHDRTPGILMEFTRCLAEDDGDDLVNTVKGLIERLRSLPKDPQNPLEVPADLKVEHSDLY